MKKIEVELYNFDELEEEIKEKLIEEKIKQQAEFYCETLLENDMQDESCNLLDMYFKNSKYKNCCYDLNYCQGSGAIIEFDISLKDLNKKYKIFTNYEIKKLNKYYDTDFNIHHNNSYYYDENSFSIDYLDFEFYVDFKDNKKIADKFEKLESLLKKDISKMNCELTKNGYSLIENKEYFLEETLNYLSDKLFYKNGEIYEEIV